MQFWNLGEGQQLDRAEVDHVDSLPHVEITAYQNHFQNQFYDGTTFHGRPTCKLSLDIEAGAGLEKLT